MVGSALLEMANGKDISMKTVLATLAAMGLMTGIAFAGCAGHSVSVQKPDQVAMPAPSTDKPTVVYN